MKANSVKVQITQFSFMFESTWRSLFNFRLTNYALLLLVAILAYIWNLYRNFQRVEKSIK